MAECIFCKIATGEIKSDIVYQSESFVGFRDTQPQAPTHILVVPRNHVATFNDVKETDTGLLSGLLLACRQLAENESLTEKGYRIVINCNKDGGQSIFHLHAHLLGGRKLSWPPG